MSVDKRKFIIAVSSALFPWNEGFIPTPIRFPWNPLKPSPGIFKKTFLSWHSIRIHHIRQWQCSHQPDESSLHSEEFPLKCITLHFRGIPIPNELNTYLLSGIIIFWKVFVCFELYLNWAWRFVYVFRNAFAVRSYKSPSINVLVMRNYSYFIGI